MYERPYLVYLSLNNITEELYNNIAAESYYSAVKICRTLSNDYGDVIRDVVSRLAQEGNKNVVNFAYKLYLSSEKSIVSKYFPKPYAAALDKEEVTLVGLKFELPMKLGAYIDGDGDRTAWADGSDKTSDNISWQVEPVWLNNQVFFTIQHKRTERYLKMGLWPDSINDREVFGSTRIDNRRHLWCLQPMVHNGEHLFHIVNAQFNQALKQGESADDVGDRRIWGHNGDIRWEPVRFAWRVNKIHVPLFEPLIQ